MGSERLGGLVMVAVLAPLIMGGVMTGIEYVVDEGVRNASGNSLVLFNSGFIFVGAIALWLGFMYADSIALWEKIEQVTRRKSGDSESGFVVILIYCIWMYLVKVGLIQLYALPYTNQWLTPLASLVVILVAPLTVYLYIDFGLASGRNTHDFFKAIKSALYRVNEVMLKIISAPTRLVSGLRFPGNYLHLNAAESEHYELTQLASGDQQYEIYYDPVLNNYLIKRTSEYGLCVELIRLNSLGVIIDRIVNLPALSGGGLCFGDNKYYDWPITGNDTAQSYTEILALNKLTEAQCNAYLQACEQLELHEGNKHKAMRCYLQMPDGWLVLERQPADEDDEVAEDDVGKITFPLEDHIKEKYQAKHCKRLFALVNPVASERNIYKLDAQLCLLNFAKQSYLSKTYKEINWLYWYGWYGVGSLQLQYANESLYFKAFVCRNEEGHYTDLAFYSTPPGMKLNNLVTFLRINKERVGSRSKDVSGVYIVRPKIKLLPPVITEYETKGVAFGDATQYAHQYRWRPIIALEPNKGTIHNIRYCNGQHERVNTSFSRNIAPALRALPAEITLHWGRDISKREFLQMYFNGKTFHWSSSRHLIFGINWVVNFDADEIARAFATLATSEQPLQLQIFMEEWFEETYNKDRKYLTVQVSNGLNIIPLRRAVLSVSDLYKDSDRDKDRDSYLERDNYGPVNYFEEQWLKGVYELALEDIRVVPVFQEAAAFLIKYKTWTEKDDFQLKLSYYYMKLLFRYTMQKEYETAQRILTQYIASWLPIAGLDKYAPFIASEGLALALLCKNDQICDPIFEKMLGKNFDIMQLDNQDLLFNLGCFYALHHDKDKMLVAMRQALHHGKEPEKFTTDADFTDYWQDADFLEVLAKWSTHSTSSNDQERGVGENKEIN